MEFNEYQKEVTELTNYPEDLGPFFLIMKMYEEVGHISTVLNQVITYSEGNMTVEDVTRILCSSGNILLTIANLGKMFNVDLEDIAKSGIVNYKENNKIDNTIENIENQETTENFSIEEVKQSL